MCLLTKNLEHRDETDVVYEMVLCRDGAQQSSLLRDEIDVIIRYIVPSGFVCIVFTDLFYHLCIVLFYLY